MFLTQIYILNGLYSYHHTITIKRLFSDTALNHVETSNKSLHSHCSIVSDIVLNQTWNVSFNII